MEIKHSKFKNTGILFELLVRQVTADTLNSRDSSALGIIKKYFSKGELSRELKLYQSLTTNIHLTESRANLLVQTLLESTQKLNRTNLKREKYNLIKEIKKSYDTQSFFSHKIPHYKAYASFYTLVETFHSEDITSTDQTVSNKVTLLEHLCSTPITESKVKEDVMEEFKGYDKDTRILTYKILLEKFNGKYSTLYPTQKEILREFINSVDSTATLKNFYNTRINSLKETLVNLTPLVSDEVVKIKLNEVASLLIELDKTSPVDSDNIINLMQYVSLIEEIKKANG
tara:strand:+ start:772 stop:1629 length:858 start_codon:yes stop_codon:yes gene_type:complete